MVPEPLGVAVGIGHLTMLDVAPPDLVRSAAAAGFDFVGLRVAVGGPSEESWGLAPGSPMLRETLTALADTGLTVNDVDVLALRAGVRPAAFEPALATAAALGARSAIVLVDDDLDRAGDALAELVPLAAGYGVRVLVEPMSYARMRTLAQARALADRVPGLGIMVDPLHLTRAGDTLDAVRALDPALVPCLQLCDAPLRTPEHLPQGHRLPRGQSPGVDVRQYEARAWRLPPGEGELPLAAFTAALPGVPISVEAPNLALSGRLDPTALARRHRQGIARILSSVATAPNPLRQVS
jgi:sugar phosphate isomerase/epimerase